MQNAVEIKTGWADAVPMDQWRTYEDAIGALQSANVPFMLGGAFALACYTGHWRNTKDLDLYIHRRDRDRSVAALQTVGFKDYFETLAYDRAWIYRSTRQSFIVDLIWSMANQRAQVEPDWLDHAPSVVLHGHRLAVMPAEEFLWCKLYVLQRDRCDWPDLINLLNACGPALDWPRLFARVDADAPLLSALVSIFNWVSPQRAGTLTEHEHDSRSFAPQTRAALLDSRPWFALSAPDDKQG